MDQSTRRKGLMAVTALTLAFLAGCMFAPGKFTADLDIRKDGRFTFHYAGEIHVLALSDFATKGGEKEGFTPSPCTDLDEDGNSTDRECTSEEVKSQKEEWDQQQAEAEAKRKSEAEQMRGLMGGLDPDDPKAGEELAARLRRQAGYRSVTYKGNGLYLVDYLASSRLSHGFSFPQIEGFPMANAFVLIAPRADGSVRIDAPGFGPPAGGNPASLMMGAMAQGGATGGPKVPMPDGAFTIATDAQILSNNTDEGPQPAPQGQKLSWTVNARTSAAPMALVKLAAPVP